MSEINFTKLNPKSQNFNLSLNQEKSVSYFLSQIVHFVLKTYTHNIVRHDLFMESSGKNKAEAVIGKIKDFFDDNDSLQHSERSIFNLDRELLKDYNWLIDTVVSSPKNSTF